MSSTRPSPDPTFITLSAYDQGSAAYAEKSKDRSPLNRLHSRFCGHLRSGTQVLELGCGAGHDAVELSTRGLSVIGFDLSRGLLTEAHRHVSLGGYLVQGDARALPFGRDSFAGIWSCASLLHVPKADIGHVLTDAFRILVGGGVLFTSMSEGNQEGEVAVDADGFGRRLYFYYREDDWAESVSAAGFDILEHHVQRINVPLNPGSTGWIETFARKPSSGTMTC